MFAKKKVSRECLLRLVFRKSIQGGHTISAQEWLPEKDDETKVSISRYKDDKSS